MSPLLLTAASELVALLLFAAGCDGLAIVAAFGPVLFGAVGLLVYAAREAVKGIEL